MFVDYFSRMAWVRSLTKRNGSTTALIGFIADVATPANSAIRIICTDKVDEFQGQFQQG